MAAARSVLALLCCLSAVAMVCAEDPYLFFTWKVSYKTISPLGVDQKVIAINDEFPGPNINSTSNNNLVINIFNNIDEPLLFHWNGVQQRKNSWQEGLPGTNCPIQPGTNFTFKFQVKDQIGSYFYYPSLGFQRAAGGYGGIRVHSRDLIPVPYDIPEDDYTVLIGDWYTKSHTALRQILEGGRTIGKPSGVVINGKNKADDKTPLFTMKPEKTYKYRVCNVGLKVSLNFRIQGHDLKLVEVEGSHVVQNVYESLDVHVGQCYAVLVTADKEPGDYVMVASTRFTQYNLTATGLIRYEGSNKPAASELPKAPVGWAWSLNQFRSFRWNLTASAARPNPQGSYHYGKINITRTIKLANTAGPVDGKLRFSINGISHVDPETPLKLAEYFGVADKVFEYDLVKDEPAAENDTKIKMAPSVVNTTFRNYIEIILENHEKGIQTWHLNGYSFFAVAIENGKWEPSKRKNYNLLDALSRNTVQVYPYGWAAIMLTFDNAGMWNLRSTMAERSYLGQQLYFSTLSPGRSLRDEYNLPDEAMLCGVVKDLPKPPPYSVGA